MHAICSQTKNVMTVSNNPETTTDTGSKKAWVEFKTISLIYRIIFTDAVWLNNWYVHLFMTYMMLKLTHRNTCDSVPTL